MKSNSSGFTLMEIVVTTIIVGVIASLAFSNFGGVIEKMRAKDGEQMLYAAAASCRRYALENNGAYPAALGVTDLNLPLSENFAPVVYINWILSVNRNSGLYRLQIDDVRADVGAVNCVGLTAEGVSLCRQMGY